MSEPPRDDDKDNDKKKPRRGPKEFSPTGKRGDDFITRNLRRVYEEVAAEPLPDDLMALLNQLDEPTGDKSEHKGPQDKRPEDKGND